MNFNALATKPLTEQEQARVENIFRQLQLEINVFEVRDSLYKKAETIVDLLEILI